MMSRPNKFILFLLFLYGLISYCPVVLAQVDMLQKIDMLHQENTPEQGTIPDVVVNRAPPEYRSAGLRDPFQTYLITDKIVKEQAPVMDNLTKPEINFSELKVQGVIWGTKVPQAIINNKVYIVGDKIDDAEIISIDNKGVGLSCAVGIVSLPAPGQESNLETNQASTLNEVN